MIEIIPNWHPLFVHFPIALLSMATLFFVILQFSNSDVLKKQLRTLAYWNLWLGTGFAILTVLAGWYAFNSVDHDAPSHAAMTEHRNWALVTLVVFIVISVWATRQYRSSKDAGVLFTIVMLISFILLVSTAWHGAEVVYRHGLGVMSLPQPEGNGHDHHHETGSMINESTPTEHLHDHSEHEHEH